MSRGDLISSTLRFTIVSVVVYVILVFFVIPISYSNTPDLSTSNMYNLTVLLYSIFISVFINSILFRAGKGRKWFFE